MFYSKSLKVLDDQENLLFLLINDSSGWLESKIARLEQTLRLMMPEHVLLDEDSSKPGYHFSIIHCSTWNRYAESVSNFLI